MYKASLILMNTEIYWLFLSDKKKRIIISKIVIQRTVCGNSFLTSSIARSNTPTRIKSENIYFYASDHLNIHNNIQSMANIDLIILTNISHQEINIHYLSDHLSLNNFSSMINSWFTIPLFICWDWFYWWAFLTRYC